MKFLLTATFAFFCISTPALAEFDLCSSYVAKNPSQMRAVSFLQQLQGHYTLGKCQVEIHVCERVSRADDQGSIVGDVLITNASGAEQYVPLYFDKTPAPQTLTTIENGKIMFHYELDDQHTRMLSGQKESVRFEMVKEDSRHHTLRVETGTHDGLQTLDPRAVHYYTWTVCQGELIPLAR